MKDHKRPETAPSVEDSVYDSKTHSDWDRSSTDGSKVRFLSMKSEKSRGEPPVFSADSPDTDCESQHDCGYDLHWQKKVEQKPIHRLKDCLFEQGDDGALQFQTQWKSSLKQRFEALLQGTLNTSVCVTEGLSSELHQEEPLSSMKISELLSPGSGRTLLTVGTAGVGKTVLVQKVILDWCEDKALQHIQLIFPLPMAQLKLLQQQSWTLLELLQTFCPGLRELRHHRVLFILDALDQCRLDLDFSTQPRCCDPEAAMSVDALLTNLMLGNVLPEAQVWIICRPGAARSIPPTLIHRVSQVTGFSRRQQQLYLLQNQKNLQGELQNQKNLQGELQNQQDLQEELQEELQGEVQEEVSGSCEALHSLYRLPLFCSISVSVSPSLSLTQQLLHFVSYHMKLMEQRYGLQRSRVSTVVKALCGLALQQLQRGELTFCEEQLSSCGLGVREAGVYSGLCCQVFTEDLCGGHWTFSFVHPCLQEFLSALFIHMDSSADRQSLHRALKDHPRVLHFLQELDMDSSVSERDCSSETLTDSRRRSAQICEADSLSERTMSASEESKRHSRNPAAKRSKASLCRSQARVNGEGQTEKNWWNLFCRSFKGTMQKLSGCTLSF